MWEMVFSAQKIISGAMGQKLNFFECDLGKNINKL